jgi:hypothetical protein
MVYGVYVCGEYDIKHLTALLAPSSSISFVIAR